MRSLSLVLSLLQLLALASALWPEPTSITTGSSVLYITPSVKFSYKPLAKRSTLR